MTQGAGNGQRKGHRFGDQSGAAPRDAGEAAKAC
jgi:hypothetical protein